MLKKIAKGFLGLNGAAVVRAFRFGLPDAVSRLAQAYRSIAPFEDKQDSDRQIASALQSIREVPLSELVEEPPIVRIDSGCEFVDGCLPLPRLVCLLSLACDRKPGAVLEIGTYCGSTTRALSMNLPASTIHTVDLPPDFDPTSEDQTGMPKDDLHLITGRRTGYAFRLADGCKNIVQHFADTATWNFAPARGCTFFFIDGSHTYEYAKNDTLKCFEVAGFPATFVWDNCSVGHPGVARFLAELVKKGYPVVRIRGASLAVLDRVR